jgi:hypothetical protein
VPQTNYAAHHPGLGAARTLILLFEPRMLCMYTSACVGHAINSINPTNADLRTGADECMSYCTLLRRCHLRLGMRVDLAVFVLPPNYAARIPPLSVPFCSKVWPHVHVRNGR